MDKILASFGQATQPIIDLANSPKVTEQYRRETNAAWQLGVFGSPTFALGQEIFWGDDRLEEALAWCTGQHPGQIGERIDSGIRGTPHLVPTSP